MKPTGHQAIFAHNLDFLTSNFESDDFSIQRFLDLLSLGFEDSARPALCGVLHLGLPACRPLRHQLPFAYPHPGEIVLLLRVSAGFPEQERHPAEGAEQGFRAGTEVDPPHRHARLLRETGSRSQTPVRL